MVKTMTPVTVRVERDRPGWFAELVELGPYAHGRTKREALEKLADCVLDYWFHLTEDAALRRTESYRQHDRFYQKHLWPAVLETLHQYPSSSLQGASLLRILR